jgi:hypothetical protein
MFRLCGALIAVAWWGTAACAGDDPRALVERGIRAMGGRQVLQQRYASLTRVRGKLVTGANFNLAIEGAILSEPEGRSRLQLEFDPGGMKVEMLIVLDGAKSWQRMNGEVTDFTPEQAKSLEASAYRDRVTGLLALLDDKGFTLASLGETKVRDRPAAGVKVSSKSHPDISLYFDKETGFLVKSSYRGKDTDDPKDALRETVFADYREPALGAAEERALRQSKVDVSDRGLIEYVRRQAPDPRRLEKIRTLVRQLGDDAFAVREQATAELKDIGAPALPALREAAKDPDREIARRAQECLAKIGEDAGGARTAQAVRLLGVRHPPGAAEVLLNLVGGADAALLRDVKAALFALAQTEGPAEAALVKVLQDKDPARRAVAAAVLGKDGGAYLKEPRRRIFARVPKQASKQFSYVDGNLQVELEATDWEFFNRFEDKDFAKP